MIGNIITCTGLKFNLYIMKLVDIRPIGQLLYLNNKELNEFKIIKIVLSYFQPWIVN